MKDHSESAITIHAPRAAVWLGWLPLAVLIALPAGLAQQLLEPPGNAWLAGLVSLGLVLALTLASRLGEARWLPWLASLLLAGTLLVHLLLYGVARFSGIGFGQEFFLHLEPESLRVAWLQYPLLLSAGALLLAAFVPLAALLLQRLPHASGRQRWPALAGLAVLAVALTASRDALPGWQLARSAHEWLQPTTGMLSPERVASWEQSGLVTTRLPPKHEVWAQAPDRPRNLILLYLESGSLALAYSSRWPGLMPNLARLQESHGFPGGLFTSAFITIEGIVNSQCGTLFPFTRGNDSLAEGANLGEDLACLGDILEKAGYRQVYMGGADLGFAGKGTFLESHGYDELWGMHRWAEQGLHQRPGTWGVSDPDLFEQAFSRLEGLRSEGKPFNLTLLTIGTHLPGFNYAECENHTAGLPKFAAAVACTDFLLGQFVDRLQAEGQLEDTLLVVTADHPVFPSAEMRELFGPELIADRRLPLLLIGAGSQPLQAGEGAGYDLAPTVLDLLGIEHNARFALGRSLARDAADRNYFATRYGGFHDGRYQLQAAECSEGGAPIQLPLDRCQHQELVGLVQAQVRELSRGGARLACTSPAPLRLSLPDDPSAPLQLELEGEDQATRFVHSSRPVAPDQAGWWRIEFAPDGEVLARSWLPVEQALALPEPPAASPGGTLQVQVWRGDEETLRKPYWLPLGPPEAGAWLMSPDGQVLDTAREAADRLGALQLGLDARDCRQLLQPG